MAGGKGKSSGGKSSGGKTSAADGQKKQQSHSARAGLQVSTFRRKVLILINSASSLRPSTDQVAQLPNNTLTQLIPTRFCRASTSSLPGLPRTAAPTTTTITNTSVFHSRNGYDDIAHILLKCFMPTTVKSDNFARNKRWIRPVIRFAPDRVDGMKLA